MGYKEVSVAIEETKVFYPIDRQFYLLFCPIHRL
jgi:hypothetical protein